MPIKIPNNLPAAKVLEKERINIIKHDRALRQDIRPMRIALLNLMPNKVATETQIARAVGCSPLQVELTLLRTQSYTSKTTSLEHLNAFYKTFDDVKDEQFDGIIINGTPVAHMEYEDVDYWPEIQKIFEWSETHAYSQFFLCWGAKAALYHYHDINKTMLPDKQFGVFDHKCLNMTHPLTYGFNDTYPMPVAQVSIINNTDLKNASNIEIISNCSETGVGLAYDAENIRVYLFKHPEYERHTIREEYLRDLDKGDSVKLPQNYFPDNDPKQTPPMTWRAHRTLLFQNWLNLVYQGTPYDLKDLKNIKK